MQHRSYCRVSTNNGIDTDADEIMKIIDNLNKLNDVLHPKEQIILKKIKKEGGK